MTKKRDTLTLDDARSVLRSCAHTARVRGMIEIRARTEFQWECGRAAMVMLKVRKPSLHTDVSNAHFQLSGPGVRLRLIRPPLKRTPR